MYFANPLGLLGLLALPTIAVIHLYHRRFPPLQIAGLHLWTQETRKDSPGRKREQLPITRSLLLELLAALLIALLLADPRDASTITKPHLVVVLDDSASMSARASGISSRDRAVEWLKGQESSLGRGGVVSVLLSGIRPTLIAGPRASWPEMLVAMEDWQPQSTQHDFGPAWDLAAQLAGEQEGRIAFLTDRLPGESEIVPERMETVSVGRKMNNVAITAARWLFDADTGEGTLFTRIANLGAEEETVQLSATAGSSKLIDEPITLPSNTEKAMQWAVPGGLSQIRFKAQAENDPLPIDHEILLIEPEVRLVTVAVTLPSNHSAFEPIKKILGVLPNVQLGDPPDSDLIISQAAEDPVGDRSLWWLGIGPLNPSTVTENGKTVIGPYLIEKHHPLMNGVVLGGVVWGGIQNAPEELSPIISTGSTMLFGQRIDTSSNAYLLNIDLGSTNLTESPDWPIFWTNLIEQCRISRPGFRRWNFHLDESIPFTLPLDSLEKEEQLILKHGDSEKTLVRMENMEIPPRSEVGLYQVLDGDNQIGEFAVNFFDREESDLTQLLPGERPPSIRGPALGIHVDNPFSWLLVIGLLMTLAAIFYDWAITRSRNFA
ncbi:VWA domain-containing protein [Rubinisphaera sp.]|uniref:vWA domain-containing protein n=1 Tax=Rubinisphaera sp. TaxID=2024857 RepID=UPI0025ED7F3B|nr:VWA domain-containing protein [Rubinisphaera sp.]|tara:strand:- start:3248 stop:5062 length:1815 start_codon:yes stop_codon:yes gene_type:complete